MTDYQLGQSIGQMIARQMATSADPELLQRRLLAQLQDVLGADTSLLAPLRDLITRPMFQQLVNPGSPSRIVAGRESLLESMADTYSVAVITRLDGVLRGCFGMPDVAANAQEWATASSAPPPQTPLTPPTPPASPHPPAAQPQVIAIPQPAQAGNQGATAAVIALLSLLAGSLLVSIVWLLMMQQRSPAPTAQSNSASPPPAAPPSLPAENPKDTSNTQPLTTPESNQHWGSAADYKFGQLPGGNYPNSCAFSKTDAKGDMILDKGAMEFWACRDEGGDPETGYTVVWGDGKRTIYTFNEGGAGTIVATNGKAHPITWSNSNHNGQSIIVISHQDGAQSWIPGSVN